MRIDDASKEPGSLQGLMLGDAAGKPGCHVWAPAQQADAAAACTADTASAQLASALKILAPGMKSTSPPNDHSIGAGALPQLQQQLQLLQQAQLGAQPQPPPQRGLRVTFDIPDVDAAKKAVGAALAGLDLGTAKVNLDASKAAVDAMRASGELPVPVKKPRELRSASARQLSYAPAAGAPGAPPLRHNLPLGAGAEGENGGAVRRSSVGPVPPRRVPPGRSISMPFVMHGRAGMQARLATTLSHDAVLQQQLSMLQGAADAGAGPGRHHQLQFQQMPQQGVVYAAPQQQTAAVQIAGPSAGHRITYVSVDDSVLPALTAGGDAGLLHAAHGHHHHHAGWAAAALQQQQHALAQSQSQLVMQMQAQQQQQPAVVVAASSPLDQHMVWGTAGAQQLPMNSVQHASMGVPTMLAGPPAAPMAPALDPAATLDSYSNSSWQLLALAHSRGGAPALAALSQELSLLAAACGAFGALPAASDARGAAADLSLVASAAQRHVSMQHVSGGLSGPAGLVVQLLASFAAPLCHVRGSPQPNAELLDGCFLLLNALSSSDHDLSATVSCYRSAALASPPVAGPDAELGLMKRQATAHQALAALSGFVERNQQLLATMSTSRAAAAAVSAPLRTCSGPHAGDAVVMHGGGGAGSPGSGLSPTRDTPLASFFASSGGGASGPLSGPLDGGAPAAGAQLRHSPLLVATTLGMEVPGLMLDGRALHAAAGGGAVLLAHHGGGGGNGGGVMMPMSGPLTSISVSLPLA